MERRGVRSTAGLDVVKEQLEVWRKNRKRGAGRIPEELWEAAAGLCRRHAPGTVARRLGLSYARLKSRVVEKEDFIEFDMGLPGWRLECSRPDGARMALSGNGPLPEGMIRQFLS